MSGDSRQGLAVVLAKDAAESRPWHKVLHAAVGETVHGTDLSVLQGANPPELLVVEHSLFEEISADELFLLVPPDRIVLLAKAMSHPAIGELCGMGVRHLLYGEPDLRWLADLRVAAHKIVYGPSFGTDKYVGWGGSRWTMPLTCSDDKGEALALARRIATTLHCGNRRLEQLEMTVEELVTNALYNAPVDASRSAKHSFKSRAERVELASGQSARLTFATDGVRLAVSARDPFGSLSPHTVLSHLAQCYARALVPIGDQSGGAGLGLYYVYASVSYLVVNIEPGTATEVIGLIDLSGPPGQLDRKPHGFGLFT